MRKAQHLLAPIEHLPFDIIGDVIAAAHVGIHRRGQHFGQHAKRCAGADDPAPEARMNIAHRIRQDLIDEVLIRLGGALRLDGQRRVKVLLHPIGRRLPHGPLAHRLQIRQHVIHHAMA